MDHAVATAKGSMDIDDEEDVCRICRDPGDSDNPLRYPCACRGSIKFVHQDCLLQWLCYCKTRRCEVCKRRFSFSPVYAEKAPTRLPFHEFVLGTAMKACRCRVSRFFLRLSFVLSVWLLTIPFVTSWIWRLAFVRSFGEAHRLLVLSHVSTTVVILADCLLGFLLSASIFFILTPLRNYFRHLRVPFYVLVGMQGPVFPSVENAFAVLASNMIFLGVVIFVPFTLGRVILYHFSWLFAAASGPAVTASVHFVDVTLKSVLTVVSNWANEGQGKGLLGQLIEMVKLNGSELNGANNTPSVGADLLKGSAAGLSKLYDVTTLTVGYMFIVFLVFLYRRIIALIGYFKGEPLTVGRFYGIAPIVETVPPLLRQFLAGTRIGIRVAFFVVFELGVFPLMCGWWLDVCTVRMFGKTMSHRVQFLSVSPLASLLVHWAVGYMYAWQTFIFENLLREVLRPEVLFFLYEHADEDALFQDVINDPVYKVAWYILVDAAAYGALIVMVVYLPVKLAIRMAPSIFPLDISVSDPFTEIPAGMLLFTICTPFIIEHFRLRTTIKSLLRCWFTGVGWALGLTDFLLPRPEDNVGQDNGNGEPGRQNRAEVLQVGGPDRARVALPGADDPNRSLLRAGNVNTGEEQSDSEYNFVVRIILLLFYAWLTLLLFNSALIVVSVSLGRALFSAIPILPITHGIKCNDLYAFVIGTYALWTTISGARYAIKHVKSKRASVLLNQIWKWCGIVFKSSVLLAIWVFIIPVLIGLLFELLVIVPMRVPVDESPVFLLYQDWALGLIFLKIWTRLVMLDHMLPIVDDSWRAKFERVREDGFSRLQGVWVLREIVFPIVMKLLTALCVPYVLARGVFPMLGYSLVVNSAVYRFAWIGCLSVSVFCFCAKRCHVWFRNLHNSIRDDRYLIGRRLHNFREAALAKPKPKRKPKQ